MDNVGMMSVRKAPSVDVCLRHVNTLCGGDAAKCDTLLDWTANMLKHPDIKPGKAMVLTGPKGTGKDAFAMLLERLLGENMVVKMYDKEVYNEMLDGACAIYIPEFDGRSMRFLNSLIVSDRITIKRKFQPTYSIVSHHRVLITTNMAPEDILNAWPFENTRLFIIAGDVGHNFEELFTMMDDPEAIKAIRAYLMSR